MQLTAECRRSDGWWAVEVPEIDGLYTQARRLDQVEAMVLDAASMMGNPPQEGFTVAVVPILDVEDERLLSDTLGRRAAARKAQEDSAAATRRMAAHLREQGLPVRDVAMIMGISPQRVSKISA